MTPIAPMARMRAPTIDRKRRRPPKTASMLRARPMASK
jgi:hypothetical protein